MHDYWESIPQELADAALKLIDLLNEQHTLSGQYADATSVGAVDIQYMIVVRDKSEQISGPGDLLLSLEVLGLLKRDTSAERKSMQSFSITPEALEFAQYKQRNRFVRWWQRVVIPNAPAAGAIATGILVALLTIIQIWEALPLHIP